MTALQVLTTMGQICKSHRCKDDCPLYFSDRNDFGCYWSCLDDREVARKVIKICEKERAEK